jgi:hypothetical protein
MHHVQQLRDHGRKRVAPLLERPAAPESVKKELNIICWSEIRNRWISY